MFSMIDVTSGAPLIAYCIAVLVLAGFVKGVIGFGLPAISVGLMGLVMAPLEAAALLLIPNFVTNVWQVLAGPDLAGLLKRLWPMLLGIFIGTIAGPLLVAKAAPAAGHLLGLVLLIYGLIGFFDIRFKIQPSREVWLGPVSGVVTGLITIATGIFTLPTVPYLQALDLDRDHLVQAMGFAFLTSTVALTIALWQTGDFGLSNAGYSLAALAPALIAMWLGQIARSRISQRAFRLCFFAGLSLFGGLLAVKPS